MNTSKEVMQILQRRLATKELEAEMLRKNRDQINEELEKNTKEHDEISDLIIYMENYCDGKNL